MFLVTMLMCKDQEGKYKFNFNYENLPFKKNAVELIHDNDK